MRCCQSPAARPGACAARELDSSTPPRAPGRAPRGPRSRPPDGEADSADGTRHEELHDAGVAARLRLAPLALVLQLRGGAVG
jgi:hypothetical protein